MDRNLDRARERERERERETETQSLSHLSVHQWVRSAVHASQQAHLSYRFRSLKLPPPPSAVLLVYKWAVQQFKGISELEGWIRFSRRLDKAYRHLQRAQGVDVQLTARRFDDRFIC